VQAICLVARSAEYLLLLDDLCSLAVGMDCDGTRTRANAVGRNSKLVEVARLVIGVGFKLLEELRKTDVRQAFDAFIACKHRPFLVAQVTLHELFGFLWSWMHLVRFSFSLLWD